MHFLLALLLAAAGPDDGDEPQDKTQEEIDKLKKELRELREGLERANRDLSQIQEDKTFLQRFRLQLYSNVTGRFDDRSSVRNSAATGQVNLFIQSDLGHGLSVLNEDVFVTSTATNAQSATIQRIYAKYTYADWLSIKFGREHTPFGYWNYEFHHAGYLQTPAERPLMWTVESQGGFLRTHFVAPESSGDVDWLVGCAYRVNAGIGRGRA